jgi:pyridoxamine 5'-phosphate oxidase
VAGTAESDEYFAARPRGSQLGAWASSQSETLSSRGELEDRYRALEVEYEGRDVPRPPHWGGFRLVPDRIEFWRAGSYRLHERYLYERVDGGWQMRLLHP